MIPGTRGQRAAGGHLRRLARSLAAVGLGLLLAAGTGWASGQAEGRRGKSSSSARIRAGRSGKGIRAPRRESRRERPAEPVSELHLVGRPDASGQLVTVTVTLSSDGAAVPRYVSMDLGADPSMLRFVGSLPTGRGGLIVRESAASPGLISVFRSSLEPGFNPVEVVVELQFEKLGSGEAPLALSDVRVIDGGGRDLGSTFTVEGLYLE